MIRSTLSLNHSSGVGDKCSRSLRWCAMVFVCSAMSACASRPREVLVAPRILTAPYDSSRGEALWAIAPLRNESGASMVDEALITDKLIGAAEEARGVRTVPLSRTLGAMQALKMREVRTPADARQLMQAMGVDSIVVGSITSYDPYTPTLGLALALYHRRGSVVVDPQSGRTLDPRDLRSTPSDPTGQSDARWGDRPVAVVAERWDAKNNQVLMDVKAFAEGRMKQVSAMGWKRYLASMDLYSEFVGYRAVDDLLQQEWVRTSGTQRMTATEVPR